MTASRALARPASVLLSAALVAAAAPACGKRVSRIDPASVTDLSGRWNDTDSRLVANRLIEQSLSAAWAQRYTEAHGGQAPAVIVGRFRNRTLEHIPVGTFVADLERAFVNSGAVRVVAGGGEREELRAEREDQQEHARAESRARLGQELGARYMLQGELQAIEDQEGREKIVYYQVDATLVDLETNLKVWAGQHKIKKYIERKRFGL
ncbi:MAG: penicillin-binding protein activator LpoB [Gemmatimonadetes bacterium]|nr:penicillin-binding protein activator LpoB [Gemmatimonadota bacterium]